MKNIKKRQIKRWAFGVFVVLAFASTTFLSYIEENGKLKVVFFDVGQGDSILIRTPEGNDILIDGGPNGRVVQKLGEQLPFFDKDIEFVVLTHPHADHLTGLIEVLKRYNVLKVLINGVENKNDFFDNWQKGLEEEGSEIEIVNFESDFSIDGINFDVLWPKENIIKEEGEDESEFLNDNSVVIKLTYGNNSFLFTGDITEDTEEKIIGELENFNQDEGTQVLKVPHHGSKYSNSEEFIETLNPDYSVIQVGKNNYGLPALRTVRRLQRISEVFRNDENGDIVFLCDKEDCGINP